MLASNIDSEVISADIPHIINIKHNPLLKPTETSENSGHSQRRKPCSLWATSSSPWSHDNTLNPVTVMAV